MVVNSPLPGLLSGEHKGEKPCSLIVVNEAGSDLDEIAIFHSNLFAVVRGGDVLKIIQHVLSS